MTRIESEKNIIKKMIEIYFNNLEDDELNEDEKLELIRYSSNKLDHCKFGNDKPFCSKCTVHCYSPEMREKIKMVMRYSGPRIIFYHPIVTLKHILKG